jgi:hypothetical protein
MPIRPHISTRLSTMMVVVFLTILCNEPLPAASGDEIFLVLTADPERQIESCWDRLDRSRLRGIAQRATLMTRLRQAHPSLLLVNVSNAHFGAESLESQGRLIVTARQGLGGVRAQSPDQGVDIP